MNSQFRINDCIEQCLRNCRTNFCREGCYTIVCGSGGTTTFMNGQIQNKCGY